VTEIAAGRFNGSPIRGGVGKILAKEGIESTAGLNEKTIQVTSRKKGVKAPQKLRKRSYSTTGLTEIKKVNFRTKGKVAISLYFVNKGEGN
jgi:hypothetical protein